MPHLTKWHAAGIALGLTGLGWLLHDQPLLPGSSYWAWPLAAAALILLGLGLRYWHGHIGSRGLVEIWNRRSRRCKGVATAWRIHRTASAHAVRKRAVDLKPALAGLTWAQRRRTPVGELGTALARAGRFGWQKIWVTIEDIVLLFGPPRSGKSYALAEIINRVPHAVLVTSTKPDIIDLTVKHRRPLGPLYVFNPSGVGEIPSTITFSPLSGCEDPDIAMDRAEDLMSGCPKPGSDGEYWLTNGRCALTVLLHAAALGGHTMMDIRRWLTDLNAAAGEILEILRTKSPEPMMVAEALWFLQLPPDRGRMSIISTMKPALSWLLKRTAYSVASSGGFDVERFLKEKGTIFLLGAEQEHVVPLVAAFTGHVAREARRLADKQPKVKLAEPLTMVLDEASKICPVPLPLWTSDMGGRNIQMIIAVQSRAQLEERWDRVGARAIINNSNTLVILGGNRDKEDLDAYTTLAGERPEESETKTEEGEITVVNTRIVPVLSSAQIANLPKWHAIIIARGIYPVVGRPVTVYRSGWSSSLTEVTQRVANALRPAATVPAVSGDSAPPMLRVVPPVEEDVA